MNRPAAHELPAWGSLARLAARLSPVPLRNLLDDDARGAALRVRLNGLLFDFTRQRVDPAALAELLSLAEQRDWQGRVRQLVEGGAVNTTENRPALHTALRSPPGEAPEAAREVPGTLSRMERFAGAVTCGSWTGCSGRAITDVVNVGIGGSDLGPRLVVDALQPHDGRPALHFVPNIDGHVISKTLAGLDPETTLFIIASKSFTTRETRVNGETARSWFLERTNRPDAIGRHFVGVTGNREAAAAFGLPRENLFPMWDWVGGRYSLWSPVGLPIMLALGTAAFAELLGGAHTMDRHFQTAPAAGNAPLLAALLGIWNIDFLGAANHAVLPYDQRLRLLPDYLQQLETESNGKRVRHDGSPVGVHTAPVVWGGIGTTGQHAFHQLLHQGTRAFSADFIVCAATEHGLEEHHRWLVANALSQGKAMAAGNDAHDPHRAVPGNHATSTIVLDRLAPATIGALLAFYEHKVFCQGLIWDINSFDQWGVELGKQLAVTVFGQLAGESTRGQDRTTRSLVEHLIEQGRA
ncbi:MAG: glucose-6-phosphate isomerase [Gammaproteobacteria bacterium]|nr:glucose-6-phosphate isomerase [Gammaproteobacteria bacterium]